MKKTRWALEQQYEGGRVLALHVASLGSIFGIPYCLLSPTGMSPEPRARSKPPNTVGCIESLPCLTLKKTIKDLFLTLYLILVRLWDVKRGRGGLIKV